jgi:hypothetical protein
MNQLKSTILLLLVFALGACERQADLEAPQVYAENGISFSMPGNWSVREDVEDGGIRFLYLSTPGEAVLFIGIYEEYVPSLEDHARLFIESMMEEFPIGNRTEGGLEPFSKTIGDRSYDGLRNEFVVSLLGVEFPYKSEFLTVGTGARKAYITTQVPTENLDKVEPGFDLVVSSLELE